MAKKSRSAPTAVAIAPSSPSKSSLAEGQPSPLNSRVKKTAQANTNKTSPKAPLKTKPKSTANSQKPQLPAPAKPQKILTNTTNEVSKPPAQIVPQKSSSAQKAKPSSIAKNSSVSSAAAQEANSGEDYNATATGMVSFKI